VSAEPLNDAQYLDKLPLKQLQQLEKERQEDADICLKLILCERTTLEIQTRMQKDYAILYANPDQRSRCLASIDAGLSAIDMDSCYRVLQVFALRILLPAVSDTKCVEFLNFQSEEDLFAINQAKQADPNQFLQGLLQKLAEDIKQGMRKQQGLAILYTEQRREAFEHLIDEALKKLTFERCPLLLEKFASLTLSEETPAKPVQPLVLLFLASRTGQTTYPEHSGHPGQSGQSGHPEHPAIYVFEEINTPH